MPAKGIALKRKLPKLHSEDGRKLTIKCISACLQALYRIQNAKNDWKSHFGVLYFPDKQRFFRGEALKIIYYKYNYAKATSTLFEQGWIEAINGKVSVTEKGEKFLEENRILD